MTEAGRESPLRNRPVEENLDLVRSIAGKLTRSLGRTLDLDELEAYGAKGLVEAASRFGIIPDFYADDIVLDAAKISVSSAHLPTENMFAQPLPDRDQQHLDVRLGQTPPSR